MLLALALALSGLPWLGVLAAAMTNHSHELIPRTAELTKRKFSSLWPCHPTDHVLCPDTKLNSMASQTHELQVANRI